MWIISLIENSILFYFKTSTSFKTKDSRRSKICSFLLIIFYISLKKNDTWHAILIFGTVFRTPLSYQYLANREIELRSGDVFPWKSVLNVKG